jgi:hypothetical protein
MRFQPGFRYGASVTVMGALYLLSGETDGFAIDATTYDSVTAAAYVGGPVGGTVATIDTGTPANDLSNVPLDASNLVNSGTSPKMVHHASSPYVRWSAHNLAFQSQTLGTDWQVNQASISSNATTAPDGTSTAEKLIESGGTITPILYSNSQFPTLISGLTYTVSFYGKAAERNWIYIETSISTVKTVWFDLTNGVVGTEEAGTVGTITSVGSGWYRCSLTFTTDATGGYLVFGIADADNDKSLFGDGTSGLYIWGVQLNRGPIATPYLATTTAARIGIPLSYDAAAAQYGILVEPAATNVCPQSEFASGWTAASCTLTANSTTAPNGTATAAKITEDSTTNAHDIYYTSGIGTTLANSTTSTGSCYFKQGAGTHSRYAILSVQEGGGASGYYAVFDLQGGSVTESAAWGAGASVASTSIVAIGDGWYRCSATGVANNNGTTIYLVPAMSNSATPGSAVPSYLGDASSYYYLWGAQAELGSVATSYIPTLGSTVTRAKDDIDLALTTVPHSVTENTIYVDFKSNNGQVGGAFVNIVTLSDGTNNERINTYRVDTSQALATDVVDGGGVQAGLSYGNITENTRHQVTLAWKANDFDGILDANALQSDGAGSLPTVTEMSLGNYYDDTQVGNVRISRLVYVPRQVETDTGNIETWRYNF